MILCALCASFGTTQAAVVTGNCGDDLTWSLDTKDSTLTISGSGRMNDWTNWDDENRSPWNEYRNYIVHVVFPEGLTYIGECAFYEHENIQSIVASDSIKYIASWAFGHCSGLKSIVLPQHLDTIDNYAFYNCYSLSSLTISGSKFIGEEAFANCKCSKLQLPNELVKISDGAFMSCSNLKIVEIGSAIQKIGDDAFKNTPVVRLTIAATTPPSGASCGIDASKCKLYVPEESIETYKNAVWYEDFAEILAIGTPDPLMDIIVQVQVPKGAPKAGIEVFGSFNEGQPVTMTNYVTFWEANIKASELQTFGFREIGNPDNVIMASWDNGITWEREENLLIHDYIQQDPTHGYFIALNYLNPNGIATKWAISSQCGDNLEWSIQDSVLTITGTGDMWDFPVSNSAPWGDKFNKVIIPEGITKIGVGAFSYATNLTSVEWNAANCPTQEEGDNVYPPFHAIRAQITNFTIGKTAKILPGYMCYEMTNLQEIEFPASITTINVAAFAECTGLQKVTCHAVNPPAMANAIFENVSCSTIPLYVRAASISKYKAASQWKKFTHIEPIPGTEDIEDIRIENQQGSQKILHNGQIYILRGDKIYTLTGQEVR